MDVVIERYRIVLRSLKCRVLCGKISGIQYQTVFVMVRAEAIREGLAPSDIDSISNDV
jgi:hypothetical protein